MLVKDNGLQLVPAEMRMFSRDFDILYVTSSPHYPQSNGQAGRAVQIAKGKLRPEDSLITVMTYRATVCPPLQQEPVQPNCRWAGN